MKKQYTAPVATMATVATQQMMAASTLDKRLSTVEAEQGWTRFEIKDVEDAGMTLKHGQSSDGSGSRAKYDVWNEWED